jgi:hypothetical protein
LYDAKTWDAKHVRIGFALVIMLDNDLVTRPYTLHLKLPAVLFIGKYKKFA